MTETWRKAMAGLCLAIVVFGAVLMGAALPQTDAPFQRLTALLGGSSPEMTDALRFAAGLMGAVTLGWGLTIWAAASVTGHLSEAVARLLWRRVTWALAVWYIVDCAISVATGFALNIASNTVLLAAFVAIQAGAGVYRSAPYATAGNGAR